LGSALGRLEDTNGEYTVTDDELVAIHAVEIEDKDTTAKVQEEPKFFS